MTIFEFLVPKSNYLASKAPRNIFSVILKNFGKIKKNEPKVSGGGDDIATTQNFGAQLFSGTCNFSKNGNFRKKIFLTRD